MSIYESEFMCWSDHIEERDRVELEELKKDETQLKDAFYQNLSFGTGGLRGIIGMGPNRMNVYTIAKATQGLANYLRASHASPSVAIARDSRINGDIFVRTAAEVLAANGVRAYVYEWIEPTPALSFAVRDLGCTAGICITASHNPADYNGYKVYGSDGCQITTEAAKEIQTCINQVDIFSDSKRIPFEEAQEAGLIRYIGEDTLDRYIDAVLSLSLMDSSTSTLKVAYTPLHGTGLECVMRALKGTAIKDVSVVPDQAEPNGHFPTCPYPNPEIQEALETGIRFCEEEQADLLLATDPDADRVGVAVRHKGSYELLTGNEMGILLLDWICQKRSARGENLEDKVVITTIVSSAMADALAASYGFELRRTLTGFKFIGEQIGLLEAEGKADSFIFGFEESCGYLSGTHARDKDGVNASLLICEMANELLLEGKDLVEAMGELYRRYGYYQNRLITIAYPGPEGASKMNDLTKTLRTQPPSSVGSYAVNSITDYQTGVEMPIIGKGGHAEEQYLPKSNVLQFDLEGGNKVLIRPSGTEPKMKAYLFAKASTASAAIRSLDELDSAVRGMLQ